VSARQKKTSLWEKKAKKAEKKEKKNKEEGKKNKKGKSLQCQELPLLHHDPKSEDTIEEGRGELEMLSSKPTASENQVGLALLLMCILLSWIM